MQSILPFTVCVPVSWQDTQEFLRCLMDQLHEELKEPLAECGGGDRGEGDERRDGDCSPSEDEFLSCDSGSSSDRGEGGGEGRGPGEAELLMQDECGGRGGGGRGISEKERLKDRRVSGSPLHGGSQEMDEDADVDTAAEEGGSGRGADDEGAASNAMRNHGQSRGAPGTFPSCYFPPFHLIRNCLRTMMKTNNSAGGS